MFKIIVSNVERSVEDAGLTAGTSINRLTRSSDFGNDLDGHMLELQPEVLVIVTLYCV